MFHTLITLGYIIPNIYVFLRIWQLFINKGYRFYYTLIYILIASIYPVSNFIHEGNSGILAGIIRKIADYLLPFYLYLFLFLLLFDILLLVNYIFKIISSEKLNSTLFKKSSLAALLIMPVLVVAVGALNFNTIRTSEYRIIIPGKATKINHLKIAFVADFHLREGTNINFVERFVDKIAIISPDLIIYGGDIVEGERDNENLARYENLLKGISARYGVFTVLGNHEYYAGQDKGSFFDKTGMKVLCDTIMVVNNSFNLGGRYDSHLKARKTIGDLMKYAIDSLPIIIIDHRPTQIDQVSKTETDIQLSGHTHNGQLFPLNLITKKIYQVSWGHRKIGHTHFFVTSGIRLWGPPVRTTGKSEIMVIDVDFSDR